MENAFEYDESWTEATFVSRVALDRAQTLFEMSVPRGVALTAVFGPLAVAGLKIDLITQSGAGNEVWLAFTVADSAAENAARILREQVGLRVRCSGVAKLSLEGVGIGVQGDAAAVLLAALAEDSVELRLISTSARTLSLAIPREHADRGFAAACRAFDFPDEEAEL